MESSAPEPETEPRSVRPAEREPAARASALAIWRAWEFLRPLYVVVLAAWVMLFLPFMLDVLLERSVLLLLLKGAVVANVAYFAGPAAELYLAVLGLRARWVRPLLFFLGTAFASISTAAVMLSVSWATFE